MRLLSIPPLVALAAVLNAPSPTAAQSGEAAGASAAAEQRPVYGPAVDRWRVRQITSDAALDGFLLRSPSTRLRERAPSEQLTWSPIAPEVESVWNSNLPLSLNDGGMWAGRGYNLLFTAGARLSWGPVTAIVAPQLTYSENRAFQILRSESPGQSQFTSPWHSGPQWADLPLRFGDRPLASLDLGQSTFLVAAGPVEVGASNENQWWGPGAHTALVMSNNAPGFPHLFLRTNGPLRTGIGTLEARWLAGGLTESLFFDSDPANDVRSFSGFAATFRPAAEPRLTLGLSRVVYGNVAEGESVLGRAFDAFIRWSRPVLRSRAIVTPTSEGADSTWVLPTGSGAEQILSLFGRWVFPADDFEVYGEWAKAELPGSIVDLATQPTHSQAYTVGLQWAPPVGENAAVRVHTEVSYLEEAATFDNRPTTSYYLSRSVPQGYTNRGQVLGAATGPGSSSQWLTVEYMTSGWRAGLTGGRIRWENDEYLTVEDRKEAGHDVSVFGGVRAGMRILGRSELGVELVRGIRYNYLFQNPALEADGTHALDIYNTTLRVGLTTLLID